MISCSKRYQDIPFAHRQHNHDGHCAQIHGHNWAFEFTFKTSQRDENGFVVDFGKLGWLKAWLNSTFDHALVLNESDPHLEDLKDFLGTAYARIVVLPDGSCEGLALYLATYVNKEMARQTGGRVWLEKVVVYEDSKNSAMATPPVL